MERDDGEKHSNLNSPCLLLVLYVLHTYPPGVSASSTGKFCERLLVTMVGMNRVVLQDISLYSLTESQSCSTTDTVLFH